MTEPYYDRYGVTVHHGDCLDVLAVLPDASVHAVVTDPPYGLEFMGKEWDNFRPSAARLRTRVDARTNPADGKSITTAPEAYVAGQPFQRWCEGWLRECLRVLKPGGHLLAFGGSRTWHRLAVAVEDAGFEVRDSIAWVYAQGFPKSLNVSKDPAFCRCEMGGFDHADGDDGLRGVRSRVSGVAADAAAGEVADLLPPVQREGAWPGVGDARAQGAVGPDSRGACIGPGEDEWPAEPGMEGRGDAQASEGELRRAGVCAVPAGSAFDGAGRRVRDGASVGHGSMDRSPLAADGVREPHQPRPPGQPAREPGAVPVERGSQAWRGWPLCSGCGKPSVPAGLGTALKPAFEPIVVGRKPLAGTVAANVLEHGTGALNVDACRIAAGQDYRDKCASVVGLGSIRTVDAYGAWTGTRVDSAHTSGRWPTNVVLTHAATSDGVDLCVEGCVLGCPVRELDEQTGVTVSRPGSPRTGAKGDGWGMTATGAEYDDRGGASRFFPVFRFEAKAPAAERPRVDGVAHPTVKPLALMRWLVRLVTPPAGTVLDPFLGSGTTAQAARAEGFRCIGVEREESYLPLIRSRLDGDGLDLFGGDAA